MIRLLLLSVVLVQILTTNVLAQEETSGNADSGANVDELLRNVTNLAERLENTVGTLSERIEQSASASDEGAKLLDEMLEASHTLNDSLNRDSEVWTELNSLIEQWKSRRDQLLERSKQVPALREVADQWQAKMDEAIKLREQILVQAAESEALMNDIADQREVVLAYYELGAADQVLAAMRQMSEDMAAMNNSMRSILDQTGVVASQPVAQQ